MLSKSNQHRIKTKARLVAFRFEEDCLRKSEKEWPTCPKDTFREMLGLAVQIIIDKFAISHKTAFLQGEHIDWDACYSTTWIKYSRKISLET